MPRPPTGKINVTRIDKSLLFKGEKGTYLNIAIFPNKNGVGQFGDTHFIAQEVTKEQRDSGIKGPIIGSFTMPEEAPPPQTYRKPQGGRGANVPPPSQNEEDSDIPF